MSEVTPGPWSVGAQESKPNWIEVTVEGAPDKNGLCWASPVAVCFGTTNPMVDTMAGACHVHANARLIAAAPDLLAAAKAVRATNPRWNEDWDALVAAIDKAEGRS